AGPRPRGRRGARPPLPGGAGPPLLGGLGPGGSRRRRRPGVAGPGPSRRAHGGPALRRGPRPRRPAPSRGAQGGRNPVAAAPPGPGGAGMPGGIAAIRLWDLPGGGISAMNSPGAIVSAASRVGTGTVLAPGVVVGHPAKATLLRTRDFTAGGGAT